MSFDVPFHKLVDMQGYTLYCCYGDAKNIPSC